MFVCRLVTSRWSKGACVLAQRNNAVQRAGIYFGSRHREPESGKTLVSRIGIDYNYPSILGTGYFGYFRPELLESRTRIGNRHRFQESVSGSTITINSRYLLLLTITGGIENRGPKSTHH